MENVIAGSNEHYVNKTISERLTRCHLDNLKASGLTDETILSVNYYSVSSQQINSLLKRTDIKVGGYALPYPTQSGFLEDYIRVKLDSSVKVEDKDLGGAYGPEQKERKYLSPFKSTNHLYIPPSVWSVLQDTTVPIILTEGEKKALKATQDGYPCIGISGVWSFLSNKKLLPDFDLISLEGRVVYIVYDGDKYSNAHVLSSEMRLFSEITKRGAKVYIVDLPEASKLDDYLVEQGKDKFDNLIKLSMTTGSSERIRSYVKLIRGRKKITKHEKKQELARFIVTDLKSLGRFITNEDKTYIFLNDGNCLCEINEKNSHLLAYIEERYMLNSTEIECKFVIEYMKSYCFNHGEKTNLYKCSYYDKKSQNLYLSRFDGMIYKIDGANVDLLQNGTDGVLFQDDPNWEPYEYLGPISDKNYLAEYLVDPVNFATSKDAVLSPTEQKGFWLTCIYSYFFESLQPTKPIVLFLGPKGSGKSSTLKWFLKTLFGSRLELETIVKDKEPDFIATVCNNPLSFFDNVDGSISWLNDRLATLSTGGAISMRELYTTNLKKSFYPKTFVGITARTPKFKRDDVVDRLLIFNVSTLLSISPESRLSQERLENRNLIMTDLLNDLARIVKALKSDKEQFQTDYRMADWADIVWRIAKIVGMGDKISQILEKMTKLQNKFFLDDELLIEPLTQFIAIPGNSGKLFTAKEIFGGLSTLSPEIVVKYKNARSLAQYLKTIEKNLEEVFEIETQEVNGEPKKYSFKNRSR